MSKTPEQLLKLMIKYAAMASQEDNLVLEGDAVKTAAKKEKKKLDPKAKVRNRGTVCVPAESAKDKKDHFPINDADQARNALARVHQYSSAPPWYNGSLTSLQNAVSRKIHSKYPSIGKDKKSAELYVSDELLNKYGRGSHHGYAPDMTGDVRGTPPKEWPTLQKNLQDLAQMQNSGFNPQDILALAKIPNPTLAQIKYIYSTFDQLGRSWSNWSNEQIPPANKKIQQEGLATAKRIMDYLNWVIQQQQQRAQQAPQPGQQPVQKASSINYLINKYGEEVDELEANTPEVQKELEANKTKQAPAPFVPTPKGQAQSPVVKRPPAYAPPPDYKPDPPAYAPPPDYKPDPPDIEIDDVPLAKASSVDRLIKKYSQVPDMSSMLGQLGNMVQQAPGALNQLGQSAQMASQIANITSKLSTRPAEAIQPITALLQNVAKNPQSASQTANMLITALSAAWGPMSTQVSNNAPFLGQMQQLLAALMAQLSQLKLPGVNLQVIQQIQSQVANMLKPLGKATKFSQLDFLLKRYGQATAPRQALTFQRGNGTEEIVDPAKPQQEVIEFPANPPKPAAPAKPAPAKPAAPKPLPTGSARENIDPWTHQKWDPNATPPNVKSLPKSSSASSSKAIFDRMIAKYSQYNALPYAIDESGHQKMYPPKDVQQALKDQGGPAVQQQLLEGARDPSLGGVDGSWGTSSQKALDLYLTQHPELKTRQDAVAKLMGEKEPTPPGPGPTPPAPAPAPPSETPPAPPGGDTPPGETPPLPPEEQKKKQHQHQQHKKQHPQHQKGQVPPPPPNAPPGGVPDYQPPPPPYGPPQGQPQFGPPGVPGMPGQPEVIYEQGPGGVVPGFGGGVYPGFGRRIYPGYGGPGYGRGPGYARGPGRPGGRRR